MTKELIALEPEQFDDLNTIRNIVLKEGVRPAADIARKPPRDFPIARLMTVGDDFPKYNPIVSRPAAIFGLSRSTLQVTVKFYGEDLWGKVRLTVGSITVDVDCRATTDTLRAALVDLIDCRVTAFPGLWEFAFSEDVTELPTITCAPVVTNATERFLGGCVVTVEGWRSESADGDQYSLVDVLDAVPYVQGEVKLGSIAIAQRYGSALWLAGEWSCPAFSFRSA